VSYYVFITRASSSEDQPSGPIALSEWLRHIGADPELRLEEPYETDGIEAGEAVWTAESPGADRAETIFRYDARSGRIEVRSPSYAALRKMSEIGAALRAMVVGEDGRGLELLLEQERSRPDQTWWRRLLGR
jgi:hypothetical protein